MTTSWWRNWQSQRNVRSIRKSWTLDYRLVIKSSPVQWNAALDDKPDNRLTLLSVRPTVTSNMQDIATFGQYQSYHLVTGTCVQIITSSESQSYSRSIVSHDWLIEQGLTSHQTHYRSYQRRFLQVIWPNQQCQSTEGNQLVLQIRP